MEFTDYMLWKALAIVVGAFFYGFFFGPTARSRRGQRDKPPE
jgi:hypothetical protein